MVRLEVDFDEIVNLFNSHYNLKKIFQFGLRKIEVKINQN